MRTPSVRRRSSSLIDPESMIAANTGRTASWRTTTVPATASAMRDNCDTYAARDGEVTAVAAQAARTSPRTSSTYAERRTNVRRRRLATHSSFSKIGPTIHRAASTNEMDRPAGCICFFAWYPSSGIWYLSSCICYLLSVICYLLSQI